MKRSETVLNKMHYPILKGDLIFEPRTERIIRLESTSRLYRSIQTDKRLRVGKQNNAKWLSLHPLPKGHQINFVYDIPMGRTSGTYVKAIQALSDPIKEHLPDSGYTNEPTYGINLRFFNSNRTEKLGKKPIGPKDVFMSHGIGDKNYWGAEMISKYNYALVPGPTWAEKIERGGYKGEIFVVGYTKLDPLFQGRYKRNKRSKPLIVWAPTHKYYGSYRDRSSYPYCNELIKEISKDYEGIVAMHPANRKTEHKAQDVTLQELLDADVVIADAGSTIYEAWALGKPVIFPDWICKSDVIKAYEKDNLERLIYEKGIGYHAKSMKELNKMINQALVNGMKDNSKEFIEGIFPTELRGKAGENAAKALLHIAKGV